MVIRWRLETPRAAANSSQNDLHPLMTCYETAGSLHVINKLFSGRLVMVGNGCRICKNDREHVSESQSCACLVMGNCVLLPPSHFPFSFSASACVITPTPCSNAFSPLLTNLAPPFKFTPRLRNTATDSLPHENNLLLV